MIKTSCTFLELRVTQTCLINRIHLEYLLLVKIPVGPLPRTEPEWWWLGWDLYFQHVFKQASLGSVASLRLLSQWLYHMIFTRAH